MTFDTVRRVHVRVNAHGLHLPKYATLLVSVARGPRHPVVAVFYQSEHSKTPTLIFKRVRP